MSLTPEERAVLDAARDITRSLDVDWGASGYVRVLVGFPLLRALAGAVDALDRAPAAKPAADPVDEAQYTCDYCKRVSRGRYVPGGWWSYPPGWFIAESAEEGSMLMCSDVCIARYEADGASPQPTRQPRAGRNRHGE